MPQFAVVDSPAGRSVAERLVNVDVLAGYADFKQLSFYNVYLEEVAFARFEVRVSQRTLESGAVNDLDPEWVFLHLEFLRCELLVPLKERGQIAVDKKLRY